MDRCIEYMVAQVVSGCNLRVLGEWELMAGAPQAASWKILFLLEENTFYYGS